MSQKVHWKCFICRFHYFGILVYCIVATKIVKIFYTLLINNIPIDSNNESVRKKRISNEHANFKYPIVKQSEEIVIL
ncbi:MAG: hypothetical protein P8Y97_18590 [Candidatus Lokiarchaeota archaeon]